MSFRDTFASNAEKYQRLAWMVSDMLLVAKVDRWIGCPTRRKTLRIELKADGRGQFFGDRLMIRRAISNLLSIALRHAEMNTEVTDAVVAAEREETLSPTRAHQMGASTCPDSLTGPTVWTKPVPGRSPTVRDGALQLPVPSCRRTMEASP